MWLLTEKRREKIQMRKREPENRIHIMSYAMIKRDLSFFPSQHFTVKISSSCFSFYFSELSIDCRVGFQKGKKGNLENHRRMICDGIFMGWCVSCDGIMIHMKHDMARFRNNLCDDHKNNELHHQHPFSLFSLYKFLESSFILLRP